MVLPPLFKVDTVHEIILKPDLSRFYVCFCCIGLYFYVMAPVIPIRRDLSQKLLRQAPKGRN